jgi:glycosyltransferase involved in cell wall biosynthesis
MHEAAPQATFEEMLARIDSFQPELVVVGNLHGANVDAAVLGLLAARYPTAFVIHDLWLLTGRCAYTGGCRRYLEGCDRSCTCDQSHPRLAPDLVRPAWETKRQVLGSAANLHLWANSAWALGMVREVLQDLPLEGRPPPQVIRFGVDLETFRPRDRAVCREMLGLPQDRFIIMSSASSLADPRKGLKHLAEAMDLLRFEDSLVAGVGWFAQGEAPPIPGMRAMGYMQDPQRLAMLYSAADLFVGPSLEEAFGQVFIEAAACGTPSVGYPIGGKPEAILNGVSGVLTESAAPAALAEAIEALYLDPRWRSDLGRWGRIWAESLWSMTASAHRLHVTMRRQGLLGRLGLGPKLNLALAKRELPEPVVVGASSPGWRAVSGFDYWEGPYPGRNLGRCRWALGPSARFEIDVPADGRYRLLIAGRTYEEGQRVRAVRSGQAIGEAEVAADGGSKTDRVTWFRATLARGTNTIDLHFWKWQMHGRPLAVLVTSIAAIPDPPESRGGQIRNGDRVVIVKDTAAAVAG